MDGNGDIGTGNSAYKIPFDPEARLNTELNNRRHSGINGFTHTFIKSWDETKRQLVLCLYGYIFTITLPEEYFNNIDKLGAHIADKLGSSANRIFANIRLEELTIFYEDGSKLGYSSWILRAQESQQEVTDSSLDMFASKLPDRTNRADPENYYFSGLSFSAVPIASIEDTVNTAIITEIPEDEKSGSKAQQVCSLCIFEKPAGEWVLCQKALLPNVAHGDTQDSVVIKDLFVNSIRQNGISVPSLKIRQTDSKYTLVFSNVDGSQA